MMIKRDRIQNIMTTVREQKLTREKTSEYHDKYLNSEFAFISKFWGFGWKGFGVISIQRSNFIECYFW